MMTDLPQHAAQIAGIRGILDGSWSFSGFFELRLFTPYWLGYGLVLALSYPLGILGASKAVLLLAMVATPWSASKLCTQMGVDHRLQWLLLATPFGFSYYWGFLSFMVAVPLGFLFLASVKAMDDPSSSRSPIVIVAWVHVLFFSHVLIAAFACIVACLMLLAPGRSLSAWLGRVAPICSVVPVATIWLVLLLSGNAQVHEAITWGLGMERLTTLIPGTIGLYELKVGNVLGTLALALPFCLGLRPSRAPDRWLPVAFHLTFMLTFPIFVAGNAFTSYRFSGFGLPLYLCMFGRASPVTVARGVGSTLARSLSALLPLCLVGWHSIQARAFDQETRGYTEVMSRAKPGQHLLSLMLTPWSQLSTFPSLLHLPAWYQAQAGGLVEPSFSRSYAIPIRFRNDADSAVPLGFEIHPERFDWDFHHGDQYDYFLVRKEADPGSWMEQTSRCSVREVARSRGWWLYAQVPPGSGCMAPRF